MTQEDTQGSTTSVQWCSYSASKLQEPLPDPTSLPALAGNWMAVNTLPPREIAWESVWLSSDGPEDTNDSEHCRAFSVINLSKC